MAYSDSFPATRPVFQADFANGGRVDPRISYSRSTTGTYFGTDKHLSSDNLLLQSSDFDTTWTTQGLTLLTGGQTDPAGGTDGFTLVEDSATSFHRVDQSMSASGELAFVVYAKRKSGTRYLNLAFYTPANSQSAGLATFDLLGGATHTSNGSSSTLTSLSATQTASGNGFYKCVFKATGSGPTYVSIGLSDVAAPVANNYGLVLYTGDGTSSIDIAFASLTTTGATDYNATTTQIHREYAPTLQTAAINAPRFEYSPTGSASEGLLIEGSSTNLVSYSESFSNQTINNSTLTEGAAVGPDGTLNANLLVPTSTGSTGRAVNLDDGDVISHTSGNNYAYSIFAKAAGYNYLQWVGGAYFGYTYCNFDLSNGTVGNKSGSVTGSVESVGNDWYRLTVVAPATTTNNTGSKGIWQVVTSSTAARGEAFTGNDYSGVLLTMAQCELSSFSSSYIRSDSGSAAGTTRAADSASMDLTQAGFNGGPFSIVSEVTGGYGYYPTAWTLSDQTNNNRVYFYRDDDPASESTDWTLETRADGVQVVLASISNTANKVAVSYDTDDVSFCASGGAVTTDTAASLPASASKLQIGAHWNPASFLNGHCKRIAIYPKALSDSNLQSLTK